MNSTLCYIRNKNNEYLLIHRNRKENDLNEGKWIGVGGKFEEGETSDECVLREVYEETGLTLTSFRLLGVVKFISDKWENEDMYLYVADDFTGQVKADCPEGVLSWVAADKVLDLPTWEGDKYFIKPLMEGRQKIDMVVEYEGEKLVRCEDLTQDVVTIKAPHISCAHGFSTRVGGVSDGMYSSLNLGMNRGDVKERVIENWNRFLDSAGIEGRQFVCGNQVHGNKVVIATESDLRPAYGAGHINECDGFVTDRAGVPLAIFTADCVPVLIEDAVNKNVGAIHCGWRSTVSDIEKTTIEAFASIGSKPQDLHIALGPSIDRCCFEVGPEVIDAVRSLTGDADDLYEPRGDKFMLDLRGVITRRFISLGVDPDNIIRCGGCTMCDRKLFFSHRGTAGNRGSLACVIMKEQ